MAGCYLARRLRSLTLYAWAVALSLSTLCAAPKTDVVVLTNGDRITGEIKSLDRGKLQFKTDDMSTLQIEWDKIRSITSAALFSVELEDGTEHFGSLEASPWEGLLRVLTGEGPVDVRFLSVVRMASLKAGFWERMDGSLSLGANYTHSSDFGQLTLGVDSRSRTTTHQVSFDLSSIITRAADSPSSSRNDMQATYVHYLERRWITGGVLILQQNEDLGIDLRAVAGGGVGRHLVQTYRSDMTILGGLAIDEEIVADSDQSGTSIEGVITGEYWYSRFDDPETSIDITLNVFPGLTEWGRVRLDCDVAFKREFFKDFYFEISAFYNHDTHPPNEDADKYDFGVVTSIGWNF